MAIRGRRPKPTAVKMLAGNPGRRPLNAHEPQPPRSVGRTPRGLGAGAAAFYRKYAPVLADLGVLTTADEPLFKLMAQHVELAQRAYDELCVAGLTIETHDGVKKNPLTQVFRDNSLAARQFATEFGMTPAARSRLHTDEEPQESLADILFGAAAVRVAAETADDV